MPRGRPKSVPEQEAPKPPAVVQASAVAPVSGEYSVQKVVDQVAALQDLMHKVLKVDQHYGTLPGTQKPSLYKAGAEKVNSMFRIGTGEPVVTETDLGNNHRNYSVRLPMLHIPTNQIVGWGVGSCSTMESKYRYRVMARKCPKCGKEAIIKGSAKYGGGWVCWKKREGCGAKFDDNNFDIVNQTVGKVDNPDIADLYNTCLKMASKRAYIEGTLKVTAASDFFTQDVEDFQQNGETPIDAEFEETTTPPVAETKEPEAPKAEDAVDPMAVRAKDAIDAITASVKDKSLETKDAARVRIRTLMDQRVKKEITPDAYVEAVEKLAKWYAERAKEVEAVASAVLTPGETRKGGNPFETGEKTFKPEPAPNQDEETLMF